MQMIGQAGFDKLLEPYHIGKVQTRNRMVKTAAQTYFFDSDVLVDTQSLDYVVIYLPKSISQEKYNTLT